MSYTIEYNPAKKKRYPAKVKERNRYVSVIVCLLICIAVCLYIVQNHTLLAQAYFDTLDKLAAELKTGTKIGQAVWLYCAELFENAKAG